MSGGLPGFTALTVEPDHAADYLALRLSIAFVGLMESLLTAKLVDDLTHTPKSRESAGLGIANILAGFMAVSPAAR
jgi:SulP family sulfate permease